MSQPMPRLTPRSAGNWFDVGTAEGLQRTNDALSEAGYV